MTTWPPVPINTYENTYNKSYNTKRKRNKKGEYPIYIIIEERSRIRYLLYEIV